MTDVAALRRHDLVYVRSEAWPGLLRGQVQGEMEPDVLAWAALGRPAIFRRRTCSDAADIISLGLPLPPNMGRKRLALACPPAAVIRTTPPPLLRDALAAAPARWCQAIGTLLESAPSCRCFGSLAWQYLTGLSYLADTSDLDLLVECGSDADARRVTALLTDVAERAPMRIDAELITPCGTAVQWREWLSGNPELLVKSHTGSALIAREALFA
ncbi:MULTISPECIES: malonate decarboxylase holo-[acyl-carrier-protein] synthase [Rhizobium]|uniref:Malonate decarboxylase holo-[acyl-carrier-protein] synthase n=1 Tax=Rhizobium tropici TaxID=398 RepID=A0A329Y2B5_RHITR|nr:MULTISPECIES: malonate decarboxylase holo-[acyl-carrier-protein] synthase [Rhizobium]MBB3285051.1 phosphoribosyl-dephospho-CoA transferase [Rhizobium sp. BK252]MBB3399790.1 phosphoribosyl-dephospho-CoA transferase [Rhizobium sp. BK289]MBB3412370.1 phosphoribosyl-dephospho-CoA transferase [Rhizobium sp. BK284]MBB3480256.1 phosphoribosyl-dephospho-CoA transferase [Rhizobium sp. BK347]MDK4718931.1 malonate decarboxylase holo-[acyl-carrier-protein] synthase [Rhizobium sp. CNPSo 3968]